MTFTFVLHPTTIVKISIIIEHFPFSLLIVAIPKSFISVIVHKIISSPSMLLVLHPFTIIFFSIRECINSFPLTFTFYILSFIDISVLKYGFAFSIWSTAFQVPGVYSAVFKRICPYFKFLSLYGHYRTG